MKNKMRKNRKLSLLLVLAILSVMLMGCAKKDVTPEVSTTDISEPTQGIAVGEPNPSAPDASDETTTSPDTTTTTPDSTTTTDVKIQPRDGAVEQPSAKISAEGAAQINAEKAIKDVSSIELFDIEGNKIEKTFTPEEVAAIVTAYNDSMIQDTSYIEMITGNTMVITLADSSTIRITSYGDENNVVASTSDGRSYHLSCTEIATILLSK